jgi:hypothetical protein
MSSFPFTTRRPAATGRGASGQPRATVGVPVKAVGCRGSVQNASRTPDRLAEHRKWRASGFDPEFAACGRTALGPNAVPLQVAHRKQPGGGRARIYGRIRAREPWWRPSTRSQVEQDLPTVGPVDLGSPRRTRARRTRARRAGRLQHWPHTSPAWFLTLRAGEKAEVWSTVA